MTTTLVITLQIKEETDVFEGKTDIFERETGVLNDYSSGLLTSVSFISLYICVCHDEYPILFYNSLKGRKWCEILDWSFKWFF